MPSFLSRHAAVWVLLGALSLPLPASALETDGGDLTDLSVEDLLSVEVVTASRRQEPLFATPSAVYVLTNSDLRRSGATNIPEALRLVPGLHVARKDLNHYVVTSRGFNDLPFSDKLLVMIDGRTLHSPTFSQVWWPAVNYPLEEIERIEVVRGPGSALWGANAINGVINIITKKATATAGGLLVAGAGDKETGFGMARHGWTTEGGTAMRLFAAAGAKDGARVVEGEWDEVPSDGGPMENRAQGLQGGFRADWSGEEIAHMAQVNAYRNSAAAEGSVFFEIGQSTRHYFNTDTYAGFSALYHGENRRTPHLTVDYQAYYDRTTVERIYFKETVDTVDAEVQGVYDGIDGQIVTAGLTGQYTMADFTDTPAMSMPDDAFFTAGIYAQDEVALFGDRMKVILGAKLEKNDYTDWQFQPNLKTAWVEDDWMLWASASRAVRLINGVNNHLVWNLESTEIDGAPAVGQVKGGPRAEPEEVLAYEAGVRFTPAPTVALDLTAFENRYSNVMDVTEVGDPTLVDGAYYTFDLPFANMYEGTSWGGSVALIVRPTQWIDLSLSYTRTHVQLNPTAAFVGKEEEASWINTATPINAVKGRLSLDLPYRFGLDMVAQAVDRTAGVGGDRYLRVDLQLTWRPVHALEVALVGRNLQNTKHKEYESQYMEEIAWVERDAYAKLTWAF
ncbi:MAG: TonB-dependent receptor [Nitrospinae bacterium]|nr:TonB-dependent receptor [Nitrospinota bacterium]